MFIGVLEEPAAFVKRNPGMEIVDECRQNNTWVVSQEQTERSGEEGGTESETLERADFFFPLLQRLHGVTSQKTVIFIVTHVTTSNLACL
jgi:hypothetical protein